MVLSHAQVFARCTRPIVRPRTGYGDASAGSWPDVFAVGTGVTAAEVGALEGGSVMRSVLIGVASGTGVWLATKLLDRAFFGGSKR